MGSAQVTTIRLRALSPKEKMEKLLPGGTYWFVPLSELLLVQTPNTLRLKEQTGLEAEEVEFKGTVRVVLPSMKESLQCSFYKVKKWKGQPRE